MDRRLCQVAVLVPCIFILPQVFLHGCSKTEESQLIGYQIKNWSPKPIWANWSLVDSVSGDDKNTGAVQIPSMWDYNKPDEGDRNAFAWVVMSVTPGLNYSVKLAIGQKGADVQMYMTGSGPDDGSYDPCEAMEKGSESYEACKNVDQVNLQYQIAFPQVVLPFRQNFSFEL